jgi:hypothetical protein
MVTSLREVDAVRGNPPDQAVLLGQAARPAAAEREAKGFGLAGSVERIADGRFDQVEKTQPCVSAGFHPVTDIFANSG